MLNILLIAVFGGLLAACAPRVAEIPSIEGQRPASFPEQEYQRAAAQGRQVFRVDPGLSLVVIEVRRAGSLARLGHDHVVASHDVHGYVLPDAGRADLYVPLDRLVVDEPELRAEARFDTQPSADAIAGTRRNMLEKVLEVERFAVAQIAVVPVDTKGSEAVVNASITVHGVTRAMQVPVKIERSVDEIAISGRLTLVQTDFAMRPFSILGGAVQVQDALDVRFRIRAHSFE